MLSACSSLYKKLQKAEGDMNCIRKFKPLFETAYYETEVEILSHQLSGILILKKMPDSNLRIVFSTKPGIKLFDFEFSKDSTFKVLYVMDQLDKKAVIKTLRKDFELILFMNTDPNKGHLLRDTGQFYFAFPQESGTNYYITDNSCSRLYRLERASKRKVIVEAIMNNYQQGMPDTIGIEHKNFHFTMGLKKMNEATQK
ncbi:MAG: hypothetical protein ACHQEM_04055 [Chitinophagales bacterium]